MGRLILIVGMLAMASPALAQASMTLLGIRSVEGDDDIANDLTLQLRESARGVPEWEVSERAVSMAQMSLAHGCDEIDAVCLSDIAKGLSTDSIIYGTMRRTSARADYDYSVSLSLFDARTGSIVRTVDEIIPQAEVLGPELQAHAQKLIARLAGGGEAAGAIEVQANVATAEVIINGQSAGLTVDGTLRIENLEPAQYQVEIVKDGYIPHLTVITVAPGATTSISALLTQSATAADVDTADRPHKPPPDLEWLGWTLIGVAGASAVGAIGSMIRISDIDNNEQYIEYRNAVGAGNMAPGVRDNEEVQDVCVAAQQGNTYAEHFDGDVEEVADLCEEADLFEVLQWVFLATAAATGGTGLYLVLTSGGSEEQARADGPSLALAPHVTKDAASLSATWRF